MTLKLFTLPVNVVIRYGVSTNTRYGIVMRVNVCHQLAPSILAASYWSAGMFCRMPVICMIVNGMPIHRFTTITVTRAQVGSVKNGSGSVIQPQDSSVLLMAPSGWSIWLMASRETNCGTAIDREKIDRHMPLKRVVLRLMIIARNRPRRSSGTWRRWPRSASSRAHARTGWRSPRRFRRTANRSS